MSRGASCRGSSAVAFGHSRPVVSTHPSAIGPVGTMPYSYALALVRSSMEGRQNVSLSKSDRRGKQRMPITYAPNPVGLGSGRQRWHNRSLHAAVCCRLTSAPMSGSWRPQKQNPGLTPCPLHPNSVETLVERSRSGNIVSASATPVAQARPNKADGEAAQNLL